MAMIKEFYEVIRQNGERLSRRELAVLSVMAEHQDEDDGELVRERRVAYLGETRVPARMVDFFLLAGVISPVPFSSEGFERYRINETGMALAAKVKAAAIARAGRIRPEGWYWVRQRGERDWFVAKLDRLDLSEEWSVCGCEYPAWKTSDLEIGERLVPPTR